MPPNVESHKEKSLIYLGNGKITQVSSQVLTVMLPLIGSWYAVPNFHKVAWQFWGIVHMSWQGAAIV